MNLRQRANADFNAIVENACEFGWPVVVTDPNGRSAQLTGLSSDIGETVDLDTGQLVSGQSASVLFTQRSLREMGMGTPCAIADASSKPWVVTLETIGGEAQHYKVAESRVDHTIGAVLCILEDYTP